MCTQDNQSLPIYYFLLMDNITIDHNSVVSWFQVSLEQSQTLCLGPKAYTEAIFGFVFYACRHPSLLGMLCGIVPILYIVSIIGTLGIV